MRQSSSSLNLDTIIKLMSPAREHLASLVGTDVVLFIGRTRSGKSTSINYMCGTKMKREKRLTQYKIVPLPGEAIYTAMDDARSSVTFYPQTIKDPAGDIGFVYCDCPGFNDNRGNADKVCTSIMMQLAVRQVRSVKAVVICVPIQDFGTTGQTDFSDLLKTMGDLFRNFDQCAPSIFFLITHIPDPAEVKYDEIIQLLRAAKEDEEKKLKNHEARENEALASAQKPDDFSGSLTEFKIEMDSKSTNPKPINEMDEMKKNIKLLNTILLYSGNIILFDPADQGNSRENLLTRLKSVPGSIHITQFGWLKRDQLYLQFYDLILRKASESSMFIDKRKKLKEIVLQMQLDQQKEKSELEKKQQLLRHKDENQIDVNDLLNEEQKNLSDSIKGVKQSIDDLESKNADLGHQLKSIDTDAPVLLWKGGNKYVKDIWRSSIIVSAVGGAAVFGTQFLPSLIIALRSGGLLASLGGGLLGGIQLYQWAIRNLMIEQFECPYKIPFLNAGAEISPKISIGGPGGYSYEEESKKTEGIYKITFIPNPLVDSEFIVKVFVRSKDFPGNPVRILENTNKIKDNEQFILKYQTDFSDFQERMKRVESALLEIKQNGALGQKLSSSQSEQFLNEKIREVSLRIENMGESINKLTQEIHYLDAKLQNQNQKYKFVFDIIEMAKHDVYDPYFCEELLNTYISWRSTATSLESVSSKENKYMPLDQKSQLKKTKADGDCAYHAILGEWDESEQVYWCRDAIDKRKKVSESVLLMLNTSLQKDSSFYKVVEESIKELAWSNRTIGPEIKKLVNDYQKFLLDRDKNGSIFWDNFISELQRGEYKLLHDYIDKNGTPTGLQTLRAKFYDALNKREGELYGRIMSLPKLHKLFCDYNNSQNEEFKWTFTKGVFQEYVSSLSKPKEWLLPGELAIIAHVFNKTVRYYPAENAKAWILNPGQKEEVEVQFVNNNHFMRLSDFSLVKSESKSSLGKRKRDDAYEKLKNKMDELKGDTFIIKRSPSPTSDYLQINLIHFTNPLKLIEVVTSFLGKAIEEKIGINNKQYEIKPDWTNWKVIIEAEKIILDKIEKLIKDIGKKHSTYGRMFNPQQSQSPSNSPSSLKEDENSCKIC